MVTWTDSIIFYWYVQLAAVLYYHNLNSRVIRPDCHRLIVKCLSDLIPVIHWPDFHGQHTWSQLSTDQSFMAKRPISHGSPARSLWPTDLIVMYNLIVECKRPDFMTNWPYWLGQLTQLPWPTKMISWPTDLLVLANTPDCQGQLTWLSLPTDLIVMANWPDCHGQLTW